MALTYAFVEDENEALYRWALEAPFFTSACFLKSHHPYRKAVLATLVPPTLSFRSLFEEGRRRIDEMNRKFADTPRLQEILRNDIVLVTTGLTTRLPNGKVFFLKPTEESLEGIIGFRAETLPRGESFLLRKNGNLGLKVLTDKGKYRIDDMFHIGCL